MSYALACYLISDIILNLQGSKLGSETFDCDLPKNLNGSPEIWMNSFLKRLYLKYQLSVVPQVFERNDSCCFSLALDPKHMTGLKILSKFPVLGRLNCFLNYHNYFCSFFALVQNCFSLNDIWVCSNLIKMPRIEEKNNHHHILIFCE